MFRPQKTALALAVCVLTACQSTQIPLKSEIDLPEGYGQNQAARGSAETARWWQNWHDPVLGRLIEQGLAQSYDIRIARSRLNLFPYTTLFRSQGWPLPIPVSTAASVPNPAWDTAK